MTREKKQSVWVPVLIIIASVVLGSFAFSQMFKPSVSPQSLPMQPNVAELKNSEQEENGDQEEINSENPGEKIELDAYLVPHKYTIFDFYSEYCGACKHIAPYLVELTKQRPDIAVRSIDINRPDVEGIDWASPVCKQHHIRFAPYFVLYGPDHKLIAEGRDASSQIEELLNSLAQ